MVIEVSEVRCLGCKNPYPVTLEHFYEADLNDHYYLCKRCHKGREKLRATIIRNKLSDIAQDVQPDDITSYQSFGTIAKRLGRDKSVVDLDMSKGNFPVFNVPYHNRFLYGLRLDDAEAYIASKSDGHNQDILANEPVVSSPPDQSTGELDKCGACGRRGDSIRGDIDEITHRRHGYLCPRCLRLAQVYRRQPKVLQGVVSYIERDTFIKK